MSRLIHSDSLRKAIENAEIITSLNLSKSESLICKNLMCEKLGDNCLCRLTLIFQQNKFPNLKKLNLSQNRINNFPTFIFALDSLEEVDLSENKIQNVSFENLNFLKNMKNLTKIDVTGNPCERINLR